MRYDINNELEKDFERSRSRDSVVGIATGYGPRGWSLSPGRVNLLHVFQTGSGVHPTSYPMGTRGSFSQGVKRPGREADQSPPANNNNNNNNNNNILLGPQMQDENTRNSGDIILERPVASATNSIAK
jgi:hypothetical protein